MEHKQCARCKQPKPVTEYYHSKQQKDGLKSYCKTCVVDYNKAWRHGVPKRMAKIREQAKQWGQDNREEKLAYMKAYHQRLRLQVLKHYGGEQPTCACCGETTNEFLAVDHTNGGGCQHRKEIGSSGTATYRGLIRNNFPPGFRVLCHNCNFAYGAYGRCPHQPAQ